jgi:hypothetical protein
MAWATRVMSPLMRGQLVVISKMHADPPARHVLLLADVLVRGDKDVETFGLGAGEQFPVLEIVPAPLVGGLDDVVRQVIPQGHGCPLIEEKPHR